VYNKYDAYRALLTRYDVFAYKDGTLTVRAKMLKIQRRNDFSRTSHLRAIRLFCVRDVLYEACIISVRNENNSLKNESIGFIVNRFHLARL